MADEFIGAAAPDTTDVVDGSPCRRVQASIAHITGMEAGDCGLPVSRFCNTPAPAARTDVAMEVGCGAAGVSDVLVTVAVSATVAAGRTGVDAAEMLGVGGAGSAGVESTGLRAAASVSVVTDLAGAGVDADGVLDEPDVGADDGPAFAPWCSLCARADDGAASGPASGVEGAEVEGAEVVGVEGVDVEMGGDPCAAGEPDDPVVGCGEPVSLESAFTPGAKAEPVGDEPLAVVVEPGDS